LQSVSEISEVSEILSSRKSEVEENHKGYPVSEVSETESRFGVLFNGEGISLTSLTSLIGFRARGGEAPGASLRRVLPAVWPTIEGRRLSKLALCLFTTAMKQAWPNLVAIEQRGDAFEVGVAIVWVERFGEAADGVKLVVGELQHGGEPRSCAAMDCAR
jgi:hypothetical protein